MAERPSGAGRLIVWIDAQLSPHLPDDNLRYFLKDLLPGALRLLSQGEAIVELRDAT